MDASAEENLIASVLLAGCHIEALRELQVELKEGDYRHGNKPSCGGAADVLPDGAKT